MHIMPEDTKHCLNINLISLRSVVSTEFVTLRRISDNLTYFKAIEYKEILLYM